jgi:hypothetical protein
VKFSQEAIEAALRIRSDASPGSDARLVADAVLAQHRAKRRQEAIRDEDAYFLFRFMDQDKCPKMLIYKCLGKRFHLSPEQIRRIVRDQGDKFNDHVFIRVDSGQL